MSTPTTTGRPVGRPRSDEVTERFLAAGTQLAVTRGPHRITADLLAAAAQAGKAGFYRRWEGTEHFLADVLRHVSTPPAELAGEDLAEDLVAVLDRHVNGDAGAAVAVLAGRAPFSAPLTVAWGGTGGPRDALDRDLRRAWDRHGPRFSEERHEILGELGTHVAELRGVRLSNGLQDVSRDVLAARVDYVLAGRLVAA